MHHFVDEAGDLSLFNKRKQVVVGNEGVSNFFIVGVAVISDPPQLDAAMTSLRAALLADPFLNRVPSLDPERRKTALFFHAKDDIPEVRLRVFQLLSAFDIKLFAAVRNKHVLVEQARAMHRYGGRVSDDRIYDDLFSRLLRNRLHLADENQVVVAHRGTKDRKSALTNAIDRARANFIAKWGDRDYGPTHVSTAHPSQSAGLQAVDYLLWALQRMYERRDDRFFTPLAAHFRLVMDLDDTRRREYGEWYVDENPLTLEKLTPVTG